MAAPTPVTKTKNVGHHGFTMWKAVWADTTAITDGVVVDVSGLTDGYNTSLKAVRGFINATATLMSVTLEFDDDSADELIVHHPAKASGATYFDFSQTPDGGIVYAGSGGTGDIVVTTAGTAAAADEVTIYIEWMVN